MSLRFLGGVSRITFLTYQSKDREGYYKAHEPQEVHRGGDDRDSVGIRVEPDPVAEDRAVVGCEGGGGGGDQARERAYADHREKSGARLRRKQGHGYHVRSPPDKHVDAGGEDVDQGKVPEGIDGRNSPGFQKTQVYLRGEPAGEDAAQSAALLEKRRQ